MAALPSTLHPAAVGFTLVLQMVWLTHSCNLRAKPSFTTWKIKFIKSQQDPATERLLESVYSAWTHRSSLTLLTNL